MKNNNPAFTIALLFAILFAGLLAAWIIYMLPFIPALIAVLICGAMGLSFAKALSTVGANPKQFTKKQAVAFAKSGEWKSWTDEQIVKFQLSQDMLCIPVEVYHRAITNVLGRPIHDTALGNRHKLIEEYLAKHPGTPPAEILSLYNK